MRFCENNWSMAYQKVLSTRMGSESDQPSYVDRPRMQSIFSLLKLKIDWDSRGRPTWRAEQSREKKDMSETFRRKDWFSANKATAATAVHASVLFHDKYTNVACLPINRPARNRWTEDNFGSVVGNIISNQWFWTPYAVFRIWALCHTEEKASVNRKSCCVIMKSNQGTNHPEKPLTSSILVCPSQIYYRQRSVGKRLPNHFRL